MAERTFDLSEIENFVNNRVWKQIAEDMLGAALLAAVDLETIDPIQEPSKISRNQGKIEALKWAVDLPRMIREEIEQKKREEKKDDE